MPTISGRRRLVVEADGGSRGNPGPAAYGALVRDADTGDLLAEQAESIGRATNNVAEYRGAIAGLRLATEIDARASIEVRMDSKLVVEQLAGRWKIKHPDLRPLAEEAKDLAPADTLWTWVPREQNTFADELLNRALDGEPTFYTVANGSGSAAAPASEAGVATAGSATAGSATGPGNRLLGWDDKVGPPTRVLLLRHGETVHTADKRFSGLGGDDPGLNDVGRRQAEAAAAFLAGRGDIDAVVASPMRRTRETAEVVADALGADVAIEDGLAEAAYGEWDGYTFPEVRERWPRELANWLELAHPPPGGESLEDVRARVEAALGRVLERYAGQTVLVVSHVTPIKVLVRHALDAPAQVLFRMELAPASLTEIHWYADGSGSLRSFSVASYLADPVLDGR